jgi:hypothetical protein
MTPLIKLKLTMFVRVKWEGVYRHITTRTPDMDVYYQRHSLGTVDSESNNVFYS